MKKTSTSERLKEIMLEKNLKQVDILKRAEPFCKKYGVKLGRNDLSQYVSGKVEPGQKKLSILAEALNVSETWLMGYDVDIEPNINQKKILFRTTFNELLNYFMITKEEFSQKSNININTINDWLNLKSLPTEIESFIICNFFNISNEENLFNGKIYNNLLKKYNDVLRTPDDRYKFGFALENMIDDISNELKIDRTKIKSILFKRKKDLELISTYNELYNFLKDYIKNYND